MTSLLERPPAPERPRDGDAVRRAWLALLLLPLSFIAAFALAGLLYTAVGHDPSSETPPHWADAVALIPAGLVFIVPLFFSARDARRAVRAGHRAGYAPIVVSGLVLVGYILLNVL